MPSLKNVRLLPASLALLAMGQLAACHHSPLHRSHGLRLKEMMAAQANAHPAHDPVARGDEVTTSLGAYYMSYQTPEGVTSGAGGGGGGAGGGARGMMTAGVMPMH